MKLEDIDSFQQCLLDWYQTSQRPLPWRTTREPYPIWVSEVMLQQTQVDTVVPYYHRFIGRFPDVETLSHASLQEVLKCWEGLGYYSRARNLHKAACLVSSQYGGKVPKTWQTIRSLPGIGPYIASAILSIAHNKPYAVVDGNVKRVLARVFEEHTVVNASQAYRVFHQLAESILDRSHPGQYNQGLMEIGALICKPSNPRCSTCPINPFCLSYQHESVGEFPKKNKRKTVPVVPVAVGIVQKDSHILITQRKPDGLLGGLWEFPGGKICEGENAEKACLREIQEEVGLRISIDKRLVQIRHAYTHFKIVMDVFLCDYVGGQIKLKGPVDFRWIKVDDIHHYPLPKANLKFIQALKDAVKSNFI